jgi:two-component system, chemotaxis family, CheB/CheR fusion protein
MKKACSMHLNPLTEDDLPRSADDAIPTPASDFPVVGLGASAGGVAALQHFFRQMPADSGMTFVVILHLSPEHISQLAEALSTPCARAVR